MGERELFEPNIRSEFSYKNAAIISIAISLKRIADALQHVPEALACINRAVKDRS